MSDQKRDTTQTVRLPAELSKPIKIKMAQAEVKSFQQLVVGLLRDWLRDAIKPAAPPPVPPLPSAFQPRHRQAHELLEEILSEGTAKDADWITGNLMNFVEAIRSRKEKRGHRRAS